MKETFHGHFRPSKEQFNLLWKSALIVLDSSVLLGLYRLSNHTRSELLKLLESFRTRLWMPHRVAEEFFANRLKVITEQGREYDTVVEKLKAIEADFINVRKHPFLTQKLLERLSAIHKEVIKELEGSKLTNLSPTTEDPIQGKLADLYSQKVGSPFSEAEIDAICKEGVLRYKQRIPPGYMDDKKESDENPSRSFGDLIIWKQIIRQSKSEKRDVILVLDDRKEDWWLRHSGQTLGPRPELLAEFKKESGHNIYFYQPDRFVQHSETHGALQLSDPTKAELKEHRQADESSQQRISESRASSRRPFSHFREMLENTQNQYSEVIKHLDYLLALHGKLKSVPHPSEPVVAGQLAHLERQIEMLTEQKDSLFKKIEQGRLLFAELIMERNEKSHGVSAHSLTRP